MIVRLRTDGAFEAVKYEDLKKGDVFVQPEGVGPRTWVAIEDYGSTPPHGLRCEPLDRLKYHVVDPAPVS